MTRRKISIATMVIAIIVVTTSGMLLAVGTFAYRYYSDSKWADFRQTLELAADQISIALAPAAWNLEYPQVSKLMESRMQDPHFKAVTVDLDTKQFVILRDATGAVVSQTSPPDDSSLITIQRPIVYADQNIGTVLLHASSQLLEAELRKALAFFSLTILFLDVILTLGLYFSLQRLILRPLRLVERYADEVASGRKPNENFGKLSFVGELDHLTRSIEAMLSQLSLRNIELQKSSERFQTVIKQLPVPIVLYDNAGNTLFLNERFLATFGYTLADIPQVDTWMSKAHPDPAYRQEAMDTWNTEVDAARHSGNPITPRIYHVTCRDGSTKIVEIGGILSENVNIAVLNDITDRTLAEQELSRHREHLEELVTLRTTELAKTYQRLEETQFAMDHAGIGIAWIDPVDGHFIYVNNRACELFGRSSEALQAMHVVEVAQEFTRERSRKLALSLIERGYTRIEFDLDRPDGSHLPVEASLYLQPSSDERAGHYIAFLTDITQRKEAERALIAAKLAAETAAHARSEFLANMSHEIRTPMNAIIGMSQLALNTELDKRQRNFIEKVNLSAVSLLGILNDILDFSKVEAGRLEIEHLAFPLERVFENLVNLISLRAEEKGIELLFDISPDTPLQLVGDPMRLGQILINLTGNAVKFTEVGTVIVRCRVAERDNNTVRLEFAICDTGIGMSEEQVAGLFSPFKQGDNSISRRYGGTGLGLAICKRLSELMDGDIRVESRPTQGSTFTLTVPFELPAADERKDLLLPESLHGERVLVVDDNPEALTILCKLMNQFGMSVDSATSAQEALSMMMRPDGHYRLLLCDWKMPGMDGIELIRTLTMTPGINLPASIIMVSAYGADELRRKTANLPLAGILTKPVSPSALLDTLLDATGHGPTKGSVQGPAQALAGKRLAEARILLVEDNAVNQELAQEILQTAGAVVTVANNGREALEILEKRDFDCVLMDVQMPVMDGLEATRAIRAQPRWHALPIIAMTAGAMSSEREQTAEAGMNGHITKPINTEELFSSIAHHLKREEAPSPSQPVPSPSADTAATLLDVAKGLSVLGGDRKSYHRILKIFLNSGAATVEKLNQAVGSGDRAAMLAASHALKGACSSIGAGKLQMLAKNIEEALRQNADEATIGTWAQQLPETWELTRIACQRQLAANDGAAWHKDSPAYQQPALLALLEKLRTQLLADDTDALETIDLILENPMPDAMRSYLNELARYVTRYQFDTALHHLDQILDDRQPPPPQQDK